MQSIILLTLGLLFVSGSVVATGPIPVPLGTAGTFAILAKSGVSTVPSSVITGNVGLSPASATFLTGFSLIENAATTSASSTQVVGSLFAASFTSPTPSQLTTAVSNMLTAYTNASTRALPNFINTDSGSLSGVTLTPGLYQWTSGVSILTDITISGLPTDTWIFQIAGTLTVAPSVQIILAGGAVSSNIVWAVAGAVSTGAASVFEGILLAESSVTLKTGSKLNGRILSQTSVALQVATITEPV